MGQNEFEVALHELRTEYMRMLPSHLTDVEEAWHQAMGTEWDPSQFRTFIRLAHNLAGSGATFGVARISHAARAVELYAKSLDDGAVPREDACEEIERLLLELRASAG